MTVEAMAEYEAGASLDPGNAEYLIRAARTAFELANESQALAWYEAMKSRSGLESGDSGSQWCSATQHKLDTWCAGRLEDAVRIARAQSHSFREAKWLPNSGIELEFAQPVTPEIYVASLSQCRILPEDHLLIARDNSVFIYDVMSKPLHRPFLSPHVEHYSDDGRLLIRYPGQVRAFDMPCAYLGSAPSYCAWLLECVTRLWAYFQRPEWERLPVTVQSGLTHWQSGLLDLLGYDEQRRVPITEDSVAVFAELKIASMTAQWNVAAPFTIEHLRRVLRQTMRTSAMTPRRVFLSREGMATRRLANFAEIAPLLERHGFTVLAAETLSSRECLELMGSAEVIVGMEGAAMANVFFAPLNARIGLVTANAGDARRYCAASRAIGQEFTYLLGEAVFDSNDLLADCDVRLDPHVFEEFINAR